MDIAISVFKLSNRRGFFVPGVNITYTERGTRTEWGLVCGGTRAYAVRFGSPLIDNPDEQSADSHFMVRRITSSLALGGAGLFQAEAAGRLLWVPEPTAPDTLHHIYVVTNVHVARGEPRGVSER